MPPPPVPNRNPVHPNIKRKGITKLIAVKGILPIKFDKVTINHTIDRADN